MNKLNFFLSEICGLEKGRHVYELLEECTLLRSDWVFLVMGEKGVVFSLSYYEDEPVINNVFIARLASANDDWSKIEKIIGSCATSRIIKQKDVIISLCEDAQPSLIELQETLCDTEKSLVLCTNEWI